MSDFEGHKWPHVSASQFKTYSMCQRKWHIERFSGLPRSPSTPNQTLGTNIHTVLENYIRDGVDFPQTREGEIAKSALDFLPPQKVTVVEKKINLTGMGMSPPLIGFIDAYVPPEHTTDGIPEVIDYKSTKSWKWAKSAEDLKTDLQMLPYAAAGLEMSPPVNDKIRISHIQLLTEGGTESRKVSTVLGIKHVIDEFQKLVTLAGEMKTTSKIEDMNDVPGNTNACGAFGGCPYLEICSLANQKNRTPFANIGHIKQEKDMKQNDKLAALLAKKRGVTASPVVGDSPKAEIVGITPPDAPEAKVAEPTPEPTKVAEPTPEPTKVAEPTPEPTKVAEPKAPKAKPASDFLSKYPLEKYEEAARALEIVVGDRGKVSRALANMKVGEVLGLGRVRREYLARVCSLSENLEIKGSHVLFVETKAAEPTPEPTKAAEPTPEPTKAAEPTPEPTKAAEPTPEPTKAAESFSLYLDCFPYKGVSIVLLEDYLQPLIDQVSREVGTANPLLLKFNRGRDLVAEKVIQNLPTGHIVVDTKMAYWAGMEAILVAYAKVVVRRFY
jgi:CRISPR/Cas system-associated exonuclease Cas4 (RecB family)